MSIVFGRSRLERVEVGDYTDADVLKLVQAVRALERLADERVLSITVGSTLARYIHPNEVIKKLEDELR